jgi:hypothetical protein
MSSSSISVIAACPPSSRSLAKDRTKGTLTSPAVIRAYLGCPPATSTSGSVGPILKAVFHGEAEWAEAALHRLLDRHEAASTLCTMSSYDNNNNNNNNNQQEEEEASSTDTEDSEEEHQHRPPRKNRSKIARYRW